MTTIDPGRSASSGRSAGAPRDPGGPSIVALPPELAARFDVVNELSSAGAQADVFVVRELASDQVQVLKVYRDPAWRPDPRIWTYLTSGRASRNVVETFETGLADGRAYELMEFLAGGDLMELRGRRDLDDLGEEGVASLVTQMVEALEDLHVNEIVHRDIKPSNILLRSIEPFEVVVADLGISSVADVDGARADDRNGTPPYTPPEFISGQRYSPASDWWALGVTMIEFVMNRLLLPDIDNPDDIRIRITDGPLNVTGVRNPRLRMLCQGLTAQRERARWGSDELRQWLAGQSPPVPGYEAPNREREGGAKEPFKYRGVPYRFADELANAMTNTWESAVVEFCGADRRRHGELRDWLRKHADVKIPGDQRRSRDPADVRLVRMLRTMAPESPPIYRNVNVTKDQLPALATDAIQDKGVNASIVEELQRYGLVLLLASGKSDAGLGGGEGLQRVQADWKGERSRIGRIAALVLDDDARAEMERIRQEQPRRVRAVALLAATATEEGRDKVRAEVDACDRAVGLPWFRDLTDRPDALWVAYMLIPFARNTARRLADQAAQERQQTEWLARSQARREWSRRQNRPQALAWGVAGVVTLAALWILMVGVSDMVGVTSDAAVVDAWYAVVSSLLFVLVVESLLGWTIGGGFHPSYSLLGAGQIVLGRGARAARGRGAALRVVLAILVAFGALAVFAPAVAPIGTGGVIVAWTVARYLRWREDRADEQARIEQLGLADQAERVEQERRTPAA